MQKTKSVVNLFLVFCLLLGFSTTEDEVPFSLEQLFEDNPDLIRLIEKRLGAEKEKVGDEGTSSSDSETESSDSSVDRGTNHKKENTKVKDNNFWESPCLKDSDGNTCVPRVKASSIIRSNASLQNGAVFLRRVEKSSDSKCRELCCCTQGCNMAVYEDKEENNCYLFDCGKPSKCRFAHNADYVAYEYGTSDETRHEDELDELDKPQTIQKTPAPIPPTLAPTTKKPKALSLYSACYWGDVCTVPNAECLHGQCRCKEGYFERNGICMSGCGQNQFSCKIKGEAMCLPDAKLCNGVDDCSGGIDESNCPSEGSTNNEASSHQQQKKLPDNSAQHNAHVIPERMKLQQQAPVRGQNQGTRHDNHGGLQKILHPSPGQNSQYGNNFNNPTDIEYNNGQQLAIPNQLGQNHYWTGQQQFGPQLENRYFNQNYGAGKTGGDYNQQNYGIGRMGSDGTGAQGRPSQGQWGYVNYKAYPNGYDRVPMSSNIQGNNPVSQNSGGQSMKPHHTNSDSRYSHTGMEGPGSESENLDMIGNSGEGEMSYKESNPRFNLLVTTTTLSPTTTSTAATTTTTTTTTTPKPTTTTEQSTTTTTTIALGQTTLPKARIPQKVLSQNNFLPDSEIDNGFFPSWGKHSMEEERDRQEDRYETNGRQHYVNSQKPVHKLDNTNTVFNGYQSGRHENEIMSKHKPDISRHRNGGQRKYPGHRNNGASRKPYPYGMYNGYPYYDNTGYQGNNYPLWTDYDPDYIYKDDDYHDMRLPEVKSAPKNGYDNRQRGSHVRINEKPTIPNSAVVQQQKHIEQKPDIPKIEDIPKATPPSVSSSSSTKSQKTPGLPVTEVPPAPKTENISTGKSNNGTKEPENKMKEIKEKIENKVSTEKLNKTAEGKSKEVPDKGGNTLSRAESNGKVIVASITNDAQGPIVALSLGLAITLMLLVFVGCRLRTVKKRIRRGKVLHSNEADYLINGMYL